MLFSLSFVSSFLKVCLNSECLLFSLSGPCSHSRYTHTRASLESTPDCCGGFTSWRTAVQFTSGNCCQRWTQRQKNCRRAAAWAWSASVYPYLLTCVRTYSSPVIVVFYSFWGKLSLKETLVWIRLASFECLFTNTFCTDRKQLFFSNLNIGHLKRTFVNIWKTHVFTFHLGVLHLHTNETPKSTFSPLFAAVQQSAQPLHKGIMCKIVYTHDWTIAWVRKTRYFYFTIVLLHNLYVKHDARVTKHKKKAEWAPVNTCCMVSQVFEPSVQRWELVTHVRITSKSQPSNLKQVPSHSVERNKQVKSSRCSG